MIAAAINVGALLKMVYASVLAGIAIAVIFSLVILGATRSSDRRRERRTGAATAYTALAGAGLLLTSAIVVYGLILVAHKS
jgi:hypothetical protein